MKTSFKIKDMALIASAVTICLSFLLSCKSDEMSDGAESFNEVYILYNNALVDAHKQTFEFSEEGGEKEINIVTFGQGVVFKRTGDENLSMEITSDTPPTESDIYSIYKEDPVYPERTIYQYKYTIRISASKNTSSKAREATFRFRSFYQGSYCADMTVRQK